MSDRVEPVFIVKDHDHVVVAIFTSKPEAQRFVAVQDEHISGHYIDGPHRVFTHSADAIHEDER